MSKMGDWLMQAIKQNKELRDKLAAAELRNQELEVAVGAGALNLIAGYQRQLEAAEAAHQDALALCEHYEARLAEVEQERGQLTAQVAKRDARIASLERQVSIALETHDRQGKLLHALRGRVAELEQRLAPAPGDAEHWRKMVEENVDGG